MLFVLFIGARRVVALAFEDWIGARFGMSDKRLPPLSPSSSSSSSSSSSPSSSLLMLISACFCNSSSFSFSSFASSSLCLCASSSLFYLSPSLRAAGFRSQGGYEDPAQPAYRLLRKSHALCFAQIEGKKHSSDKMVSFQSGCLLRVLSGQRFSTRMPAFPASISGSGGGEFLRHCCKRRNIPVAPRAFCCCRTCQRDLILALLRYYACTPHGLAIKGALDAWRIWRPVAEILCMYLTNSSSSNKLSPLSSISSRSPSTSARRFGFLR